MTNKTQYPNTKLLDIGICDLFGFCNLIFGFSGILLYKRILLYSLYFFNSNLLPSKTA